MDKLRDKFIDWLIDKWKKQPVPVVVLVIAVFVVLAWWNWERVKELPGIAQIGDVIAHHRPLPTLDKSKLSIGIVHLNGDVDGRFANDIVQDLRKRRASYAPGSCPRATQKDGAPKIAETEEIAGRKPWFLARFRLSR